MNRWICRLNFTPWTSTISFKTLHRSISHCPRALKKLIAADPSRVRKIALPNPPPEVASVSKRTRYPFQTLCVSVILTKIYPISVTRHRGATTSVLSRVFLFCRSSLGSGRAGRVILKDGEEKFQAKAGHNR